MIRSIAAALACLTISAVGHTEASAQTTQWMCATQGPYAIPSNVLPNCTHSFDVSLVCDETGRTHVIPAWVPYDTLITGIEIAEHTASGKTFQFLQILNNYMLPGQGMALITIPYGKNYGQKNFPAGPGGAATVQPMGTDANSFLRVNYACKGGGQAAVFITVSYMPRDPVGQQSSLTPWTCQGRQFQIPSAFTPYCTWTTHLVAKASGMDTEKFGPSWEPVPIMIVDAEVAFYTFETARYIGCGNGYFPDMFCWISSGGNHAYRAAPPGSAMPAPGGLQTIDVHYVLMPGHYTFDHGYAWHTVGYWPQAHD